MLAATVPPNIALGVYSQHCYRCGDSGLWLTPTDGRIGTCPVISLGQPHAELNAAARLIERAGRSLDFRKIKANPVAFDVARALVKFDCRTPCSREYLLDKYFGWASHNRLRKFHSVIEELRAVWLLPVVSRKGAPSGYWISTDQKDFEAWVERASRAPRTQMTTIFRLAKANWPVYGEQIEMEFWRDMGPAE